jgi:carbonic anhydrase
VPHRFFRDPLPHNRGRSGSEKKDSCFAAFAAFAILPILPTAARAQQSKAHWSYTGEENPAKWGELDSTYATCSTGKTQSPINITSPKPADLPALQFKYNAVPLNIIDNGHTNPGELS